MNLYHKILAATDGMDGWCEPPKQIALANLVLAIKPATIVEIGVWGGKSLFPMAMACLELNRGICIAIDPWMAEASIQGQEEADQKWWNNQAQHDLVFARFIKNIEKLNLFNRIEVRRKSSGQAEVPEGIQLLHVDGNHGPQALLDVMKFAPAIPMGGVCVLDDINWSGGSVGKAAEWLINNKFMELYKLGTGAVYVKL